MKKLLLSAVLLLSVGLNAQEKGGVGINTENPKATLDVNGDARLQKVELMTMSTPTEEIFSDCPCVLTIDKKGVIMRIPKEQFVLTDGSTSSGTPPAATTYSSTKSYTATKVYKNQNCGSGKVAEDYTVSHEETFTAKSDKSQDDADKKALEEATRLANQWVTEHGQDEANTHGVCKQPQVYTATAGPKKETRSVQKNNCSSGLTGTFVNVESPEFTGSGQSTESQSDAQLIADADLSRKLDDWFAGAGQGKANQDGRCVDPRVYDHGAVCAPSTGAFEGYLEIDELLTWDVYNAESPYGGIYYFDSKNGTTIICKESNQGKFAYASDDDGEVMWYRCEYTDDAPAWMNYKTLTKCDNIN